MPQYIRDLQTRQLRQAIDLARNALPTATHQPAKTVTEGAVAVGKDILTITKK